MTDQYITQTQLLKRPGWTRKALQDFAVYPEFEKVNPNYRLGPKTKFYNLKTIEDIEKSEQFLQNRQKTIKRQRAAEKALATRTQKVLDAIRYFPVSVRRIQNVTQKALASIKNASKTPETITVEYVWQYLTKYDRHLDVLLHKREREAFREIERKRILQKIAEVYPELRQECERQLCQ